MQRRQFIPQGAISFVEIAVVFVDLFNVISRSAELCEYLIIKLNVAVDRYAVARTVLDIILFVSNLWRSF
jgi:hypothetical protein